MSPYPIVSPPTEDEELLQQISERMQGRLPPKPAVIAETRGLPHTRPEWLSSSILELSDTRPQRRTVDFVYSILIHGTVLTVLLLLPLFFTEAIDLKQFTQTMLIAPPPPPPPPPAPAIVQAVHVPKRVLMTAGRLMAPTAIPKEIAMLKEEQLPEISTGVTGGIPGGVPGGQVGGVLGGIIQGSQRVLALAPPPSPPKAPLRVGGRVKSPRPISTPNPVYPPLARQAKIQGDVQIDAVIDAKGDVVEMQLVSGHPLLVTPAMEAVRRWKYEPTILNDEPVSVQLIVVVRFRLDGRNE